MADFFRFLVQWILHPKSVGGLAPSGRALTSLMAAQVDLSLSGPVVELGPGTGVITQALLNHGVGEERLVLLEYNPDFAKLLQKRFPRARIITGDAFKLSAVLDAAQVKRPAAIVSGLPLFNWPTQARESLLDQVLTHLDPEGAFIQFSYRLAPPIADDPARFRLTGTRRVWLNLFPARVWIYRPLAK